MSGRDKATNQLKDYQKKRGPGVRSVVECSTDGTTVVLIVYSAPDQVMQTAEELMARPFLAEKVSKGKFPQVSLSLQWYKCFGQR